MFIEKRKRCWIAKGILSTGEISNLKLYNEAIVTKTVWYWHKDEHVDQWNIAEDLKISTHSDSQLIFDKSDKHILKKTPSSATDSGKPE